MAHRLTKLNNIISETYEMIYPNSEGDGWITTCVQQYIGPDLVMISDHCYTTYINLVWKFFPLQPPKKEVFFIFSTIYEIRKEHHDCDRRQPNCRYA